MNELLNVYNSQCSANVDVWQMHTDRHSDMDLTRVSNGNISHSEYDHHTDQMWDDGEEE